eukprot:4798743-Amphidinium_carterae.1
MILITARMIGSYDSGLTRLRDYATERTEGCLSRHIVEAHPAEKAGAFRLAARASQVECKSRTYLCLKPPPKYPEKLTFGFGGRSEVESMYHLRSSLFVA